jgi:hypothetical protein
LIKCNRKQKKPHNIILCGFFLLSIYRLLPQSKILLFFAIYSILHIATYYHISKTPKIAIFYILPVILQPGRDPAAWSVPAAWSGSCSLVGILQPGRSAALLVDPLRSCRSAALLVACAYTHGRGRGRVGAWVRGRVGAWARGRVYIRQCSRQCVEK